MPAKVEKIRPELDSTPEMLLGMLIGHSAKIRHINAVVIWDDDSYQVVNDRMKLGEQAFALIVMLRSLLADMDAP